MKKNFLLLLLILIPALANASEGLEGVIILLVVLFLINILGVAGIFGLVYLLFILLEKPLIKSGRMTLEMSKRIKKIFIRTFYITISTLTLFLTLMLLFEWDINIPLWIPHEF